MDLSFTETEFNIINGDNIQKQNNLIKQKMKQNEGKDIGELAWRLIKIVKNIEKEQEEKEKIYIVHKRPKDDVDDEKQQHKNNEENGHHSISMLIDIEKAKDDKAYNYRNGYGTGMCPKGDCYFQDYSEDYFKCCECGGKNDVRICFSCDMRDDVYYEICKYCRMKHLKRFENEWKMNEIKSAMIRDELVKFPELTLDLLCGLPTVSSLNKLMSDILKLEKQGRGFYALFLVDMDNLKAWNETLGHKGADEVIQNVGLILKKWTKWVNDGKYEDEEDDYKILLKAFAFRQGGDEFAVVVKSENDALGTKYYDFYSGWKSEINNLVKKDFMMKYKRNLKSLHKGKVIMKQRKRKQIITALNGTKIDEKNKHEILAIFDKAVDAKNIDFSFNRIGVSVGLFIPDNESKETNWIKYAEEAQDQSKAIKGKNNIAIYWEKQGKILSNDKTETCLKESCYDIYK